MGRCSRAPFFGQIPYFHTGYDRSMGFEHAVIRQDERIFDGIHRPAVI
jgi:hypothetical protein